MKTLSPCPLSLAAPFLLASSAYCQDFSDQQEITILADAATSVYATDLDGDGDADVVSASRYDHKIAWYENLGGGAFGTQQVITATAGWAKSVYAADLDGDGDADVLSAYSNKIAWYKNMGGGNFGVPQVITNLAVSAWSVYAMDLDGDGDTDVLSASAAYDMIAWYENLGGGAFGPQQVISTLADGARSVYATDLDGDGDADVLSASVWDDKIAWYENLGGGAFGPQQVITTLANGASHVYATDLDGDGDADVLSASVGKIAWYENLGGGSFGSQQVITTLSGVAFCVYATDLDGDGDADVLSTAYAPNKIAWYENLVGSPLGGAAGGGFGPQQVITTLVDSATSVYATDLDGDGFVDVISASENDDKIAWYKNLMGPIGTSYCGPANQNSSGQVATILAYGSDFVATNDVRLDVVGTATNRFAMFLNSPTQGFAAPPGSQGFLCLGGAIGPYDQNIKNTGPAGAVSLQLDLPDTPTPGGPVAIQPGETWNFQLWFRDLNPGATSNFSDGVSITFL